MTASGDGTFLLLTFHSIHGVLGAEKQLKTAGLWHDVVPIPRVLSSDCQMAVRVCKKDVLEIRSRLAAARVHFEDIYEEQGREYLVFAAPLETADRHQG